MGRCGRLGCILSQDLLSLTNDDVFLLFFFSPQIRPKCYSVLITQQQRRAQVLLLHFSLVVELKEPKKRIKKMKTPLKKKKSYLLASILKPQFLDREQDT